MTSSSVRLLASSFFVPLSTRMLTSRRIAGGLGLLRLLHRVDVLHVQLRREGGVAVQQVARLRKARRLVEVVDLDVVLQASSTTLLVWSERLNCLLAVESYDLS